MFLPTHFFSAWLDLNINKISAVFKEMFGFSSRFKLFYSDLQKRVLYCIKFLMWQYISGTAALSLKVILCQVSLVLCYVVCHPATEKLESLKLPHKTKSMLMKIFPDRCTPTPTQFSVLEVCMNRLSFSCTLWTPTLKSEPQPEYIFTLCHSLS